MATLFCARGIPASGKTTAINEAVALSPKTAKISRDDIRAAVFLESGLLSNDKEMMVSQIQRSQAAALLRQGWDVIVDDQNLRMSYLKDWRRLAEDNGADFDILDFTGVPLAHALENNEKRAKVGGRFVDPEYIKSQHAKFVANRPKITAADVEASANKVTKFVPYNGTPGKPDTYIFDIDGTLAHMTGRQWFEFDKVFTDALDVAVARVLDILVNANQEIIILSGRGEDSRDVTEKWLEYHGIPYAALFMRAAGDSRQDAVVKNEIFERDVAPNFNVLGVFDDRDQVVEMWRAKGIKCFQVAPGNF